MRNKIFGYTESLSRRIFSIDSVLKTSPWSTKIKDLNGRLKNLKGFMKNNCC